MSLKILVATDLSARSDRPFERAAIMAARDGASATALHVFDDLADEAEADQMQVEAAIAHNFPKEAAGFSVIAAHGSPPKTIALKAAELNSDIVIVGPARQNSLSDYFLGTAVDHLVRHAEMPVLVVKARPHGQYKNILLATDFSDNSAYALQRVLALFPDANIFVGTAFHVAYEAWLKSDGVAEEMAEEAKREMNEFLDRCELSSADRSRISNRIVEGSLHQAMYKLINHENIDLLAMGTQGRGGIAKAALGSNASDMLKWSPVDCLMVRMPK